jgi:hypothetical protein
VALFFGLGSILLLAGLLLLRVALKSGLVALGLRDAAGIVVAAAFVIVGATLLVTGFSSRVIHVTVADKYRHRQKTTVPWSYYVTDRAIGDVEVPTSAYPDLAVGDVFDCRVHVVPLAGWRVGECTPRS